MVPRNERGATTVLGAVGPNISDSCLASISTSTSTFVLVVNFCAFHSRQVHSRWLTNKWTFQLKLLLLGRAAYARLTSWSDRVVRAYHRGSGGGGGSVGGGDGGGGGGDGSGGGDGGGGDVRFVCVCVSSHKTVLSTRGHAA